MAEELTNRNSIKVERMIRVERTDEIQTRDDAEELLAEMLDYYLSRFPEAPRVEMIFD